ncbi:hypothetical protein BH23ACT10_BH23ACT10_09540 [soil metagenome]
MTAVADARSQHAVAGEVAVRVVRLLNEVEAGLRPARQVCPLFASHLHGAIRRTPSYPGPVPDLRRLVITTAVAGAYEVVAICHRAGRFRAIGLRLSRTPGDRWIVTDVVRPPGGRGGRSGAALSDPTGPLRPHCGARR